MPSRDPNCNSGWKAPDFVLPATDGSTRRLADIRRPNGTLIMFICNHCPYVLAILDRLRDDVASLQALGVGVAAICSNDAGSHPVDSFPNMQDMAGRERFRFPYLHDETQKIARSYGAVCTPDFFGFNAQDELQYRGRLDEFGRNPARPGAPRELLDAMKLITETGRGPTHQVASMGCSIKWKPT